jgi:hypothetical protein
LGNGIPIFMEGAKFSALAYRAEPKGDVLE